MPNRLPLRQLVKKMGHDIKTAILLLLRWSLVGFVWLGWLPYCTRHIWRSSIRVGDSLSSANATLAQSIIDISAADRNSSIVDALQQSRDTFLPFLSNGVTSSEAINRLLIEIMEGQVITSIIIVIFVVVFLIREWIVQNNANLLAEAPHFIGVPEAMNEVEPVEERPANTDAAEPRTLVALQQPPETPSPGDWEHLRFLASSTHPFGMDATEDHPPSVSGDLAEETSELIEDNVNPVDDSSMTVAELKALRRQAVLTATMMRLQGDAERVGETAESVLELDRRLAEQSGEPSSEHARLRAARQRSVERRMWEQNDVSTDQYPDSPMPLPEELPGSIPSLVLQDPQASSNEAQTVDNTAQEAAALSESQLEILLEQVRLAPSPAERTRVANAAIQVCIDVAQLLQPTVPLDRANPVYRDAIRQVGMIAMVANEHGIEHALNIDHALRLAEDQPATTADIPLLPDVNAANRANIVAQIDQNDMRQLQAAVANAAAEVNAGRDEVNDDIDGLLELIGVRGPLVTLLQNSMLVVVMISGFIFFGVCAPYVTGRLLLTIVRNPSEYLIELPRKVGFGIYKELAKVSGILLGGAKSLTSPLGYQSRIIKYGKLLLIKLYSLLLHIVRTTREQRNQQGTIESIRSITYGMLERLRPSLNVQIPLDKPVLPDKVVSILTGYIFLIATGSIYLQANVRLTSGEQGKQVELFIRSFLRQSGFVLKFIAILGVELVVFPCYCGAMLDVVLLPLFRGATIPGRLAFFNRYTFTAVFLHWLVGTVYMFNFALFVSMCRDIVRPGVLFFIRDPNDPAFNPIKDILERSVRSQLRKIGISVFIYGGLIIGAFGSVVWSLALLTKGILPLNFGSSEPMFEVPFDLLLFQILLPLSYRYFKPHQKIKLVWARWFRIVARHLRLSSFLMGDRIAGQEGHLQGQTSFFARLLHPDLDPSDPDFVKDGDFRRVPNTDSLPMRKDQPMIMAVTEDNKLIAKDELDETADDPNYTVVYAPPNFRFRLYLFLVAMWAFAALFSISVTVLPLIFGRKIFRAVTPRSAVHDLFAYLYGIYSFGFAIWSLAAVNKVVNFIRRPRTTDASSRFAWNINAAVVLTGKWIYLISTMSVLIPTLLGLCLEMYVIVPMGIWYRPDYVPTVHLIHDWIVGLIYVKIFGRTAMMLPNSTIGQALNAIIRNDWTTGWRDPNIRVATERLIVPITTSLGAALLIPLTIGAVARHTIYRSASSHVAVLVYRMSYPAALLSALIVLAIKGVYILVKQWRAKIRDALYLKGRQLHNFGESTPAEVDRATADQATVI